MINFEQGEGKANRVIVHLQMTTWPGSSFPSSPAQFLQFCSDLLQFWKQQRSASHAIVAHCLAGAGRTGLLCLVSEAMSELAAGFSQDGRDSQLFTGMLISLISFFQVRVWLTLYAWPLSCASSAGICFGIASIYCLLTKRCFTTLRIS